MSMWRTFALCLCGIAATSAQPEVILENECAQTEIFDTTKLGCYSCETYFSSDRSNVRADSSSVNDFGYASQCTCDSGYRKVEQSCSGTNLCADFECSACTNNRMPSQDLSQCLPCDPAAAFFSSSAGECVCNNDGEVLIDKDAAGNMRQNVTCLPCPAGTAVVNDPYVCKTCTGANMVVAANGDCVCGSGYIETGGSFIESEIFCVSSALYSSASYDLLLNDVDVEVSSAVQAHYYPWASVNCKYFRSVEDTKACQVLTNLCVMQHFHSDSDACADLESLQSSRSPSVNGASDWKHSLPWLLYSEDATGVRETTDISLKFAYEDDDRSGVTSRAEMFLSTFTLDGEWLGMEPLASQFWYGPSTPPSVVEDEIGNFGFNVEDSFTLNVTELIASGQTSNFYELYIKTDSDDDGTTYYPCPFRDLNHRQGETLVNTNVDQYNAPITSDDVFHLRFSLFDTVGGVDSSSLSSPAVVQIADTIVLEIGAYFEGTQPSIYPPELSIHYTEVDVSAIETCDPSEVQLEGTVCDEYEVKIQILYFPDDQEMWTAVTIVGIINIIAMIVMVGFRLMNRNRTNLSENGESCSMDGPFFKFLVVYLAQGIAWIGALIPALFGFYFIVFFKLGPQPFSLLPSLSAFPSKSFVGSDAYLSFKCCVYLSGVADWIYMAHCVAHQCNVDVFFIDWEKPRGYLRATASRSSNDRGRKRGSKKPTPISAWRTIMMANEWCKLGTTRKTSIELTLITMIFVMVGCDFQYIAVPRPNSLDRSEGTKNILLDFGNNVVWFIVILAVQRIGMWMLQRCIVDNPPILFVDLCTIAKVSVMILDQHNRGYYLHCRSPYQFADGGLKDLLKQLAQEEENLTTARGLEDGTGGEGGVKVEEACQTFEMYVTRKWRSNYDTLYKEAIEEHKERTAEEGALSKNLKGARSIRRGKGDLPPEHLQEASTKISEFLRSFFDNATDHRWKIGTRSACGRHCNQGPNTELISSKSLLLPDDPIVKTCGQRPRFERVLLYGIEAELNLFNIMTFCLIDLASQNKIAAAFGCYLFDLVVVICRGHFGRANVSTKTLIDRKFLF